MGFLKNWQGSRGIMRLLIIHLICWFGWLSNFAFAKLDINEGVIGSVDSTALGITCVANLAVFVGSLIRGRLDLETGASDLLRILASPKLKKINGIESGNGLTTRRGSGRVSKAAVVMLSNGTPNWSMRQFMKSNSPSVHSILLQFLPLNDAAFTVEVCEGRRHVCDCIVIWTVEEITSVLARRMPRTLKRVSDSLFLCLLPCRHCLRNACHGCNEESLLEGEADYEGHVVSDILGEIHAGSIDKGQHICICIPMNDASHDNWTKLLVRSLRSKDGEGRGVRVMALEALEGYLAGDRGGRVEGRLKYKISSFIVPRLAEVLINLVLTFWFRVDGFSSALVARLAVKDYIVDSNGSGVAANAFLTGANVMCNDNNTQVCQVLSFRGNLVWIIAFISTGCVNIISSLGWAVLISFKGGADSSPPSSMPIVAVITAAIATAWGMDAAGLTIFNYRNEYGLGSTLVVMLIWTLLSWLLFALSLIATSDPGIIMFLVVSLLESAYIAFGGTVAGRSGIKGFGRWVYGALQILVWVKWVAGTLLLDEEISEEFYDRRWGILTYSSAFLLNAVLAGVRCRWEPWPWKDNRLFSRKLMV